MPSQKSTDVATQEPAGLPDLVPTTSMELDASDIVIPQIKLSHPTTEGVPPFAVFTRYGSDDDDPQVVVEPEAKDDDGLLIHVVSMWKSWSATVDPATGEIDRDGEFQTWRFDDPQRHPEADLVYNYYVVCPELEEGDQTPFRLVLSRSSTPAARTLNTTLQRLSGPAYTAAFRLWAQKRESTKGSQKLRWAVAKVRPVAPKPEHVQLASSLVALTARREQREDRAFEAREAEPAI